MWAAAGLMLWLGPGYCVFAMLGNADWPALSMLALAAASAGLSVDLAGMAGGRRVRAAPVHSALFGCAVTLGPFWTAAAAAGAGTVRLLSERDSHVPLCRVFFAVLGPVFAAVLASAAFTACGGRLEWPQGADSLWALACAAAVYSCASALAYGAHAAVEGKPASENRPDAAGVAAGWCASLMAGYVLAILYTAAPAYAVCSAAVIAVGCTAALRPSAGRQDQVQPGEASVYVDPVTGLANRRYLELFLEREMGRAQRLNRPLSVAVLHVDGLARLDENSAAGIMSELGKRLASGVREYDVAALHSEARVVVVLPETPTDPALEVAERLRSASAEVLRNTGLGLSVGLACFPEHASNIHDLINAAHYALNRGRAETSDRVHVPQTLRKAS